MDLFVGTRGVLGQVSGDETIEGGRTTAGDTQQEKIRVAAQPEGPIWERNGGGGGGGGQKLFLSLFKKNFFFLKKKKKKIGKLPREATKKNKKK